MFRSVLLILLILNILTVGSFPSGKSAKGTATAVVFVKSLFQLSLNRGSMNFSNVKPGKAIDSDSDVMVLSRSSAGNPWYLKVSNKHPLTSGSDVISNENFSWYGETKGEGFWHGTGSSKFDTSPMIAYESGEIEANNMPNGTENNFKFRLFIPKKQPAGTYSSTIIFTMTE